MESKRMIAFLSILLLVVVGAGAYKIWHSTAGPLAKRETVRPVTLEVWVYTKALAPFLEEYGRSHESVEVEVRTFRSYEQLFDELTAAISVHHMPQVVEVSSLYGIAQLAESGVLLPLQDLLSDELRESLHPDLAAYFQYEAQVWAVPYGASVPVVFYNKDLLKYSGVNDGAQLNTWDELRMAGRQLAADKEYWGLVVEPEVPWLLQNLLFSHGEDKVSKSKAAEVIGLWKRMIETDRIMPPLQQPLAASDFITGRAGLYLASSDKRAMLEKYIGGKFAFAMTEMPETEKYIPKVNGLAVLHSSEEKDGNALELVASMLEENMQARIAEATSQMPARTQPMSDDEEDGKRQTDPALSLDKRLNRRYPDVKDKERWKETEALIEAIELSRGVSVYDVIRSVAGEEMD